MPQAVAESLTKEEQIGHVLNRLAYGPSPSDVQRVREIGTKAYLLEQLHPHKIDETDPRLQAAMKDLFVEIVPGSRRFLVKQGDTWHYFKGRTEPPRDWTSLTFDDQDWPQGPSGFGYGDDDDATELKDMRRTNEQRGYLSLYVRKTFRVEDRDAIDHLYLQIAFDDGFVGYLNGEEILRQNIRGNPPRHNQVAIQSGGTLERGAHNTYPINQARKHLRPGKNVIAFQVHNYRPGSSDLSLIPELLYAPDPPAKVIEGVASLQQLMHLRGTYSKRQLQAVLAEFWENHFCTDFDKVEDYIDDLPAYEQLQSDKGEPIIEKQILAEAAGIEFQEYSFFYDNALGYFGDLLLYSATSPSMLIYLDSVLNIKGEPNENYAREILELYTCGVDNRYTQEDIEQLAKCFTGWTIRKRQANEPHPFPLSARRPSTSPSLAVAEEKVLLDAGASWKYRKGRREPTPDKKGKPTLGWTQNTYQDSSWTTGKTGFGYGDNDDETILRDMQGRYMSLYLRKTMPLKIPEGYDDVVLEIAYDDGYVAYLNGVEIGRSGNMLQAGSPPKHNYIVPRNHEVDEDVDTISLAERRSLIHPPPKLNTIAIQVHNGSRHSSDFSIIPRIVARNYEPGSIPLTDPSGTWTFRYEPGKHDLEEKTIFPDSSQQIKIPADQTEVAGVNDAITVIDELVSHPSTAEFITIKLINKFVSDEISLQSYHKQSAPSELIKLADDAIAAWHSTDRPGHLRTVMETILSLDDPSGPFWSRKYHDSKIKTPIEYINSCYRALDAAIVNPNAIEKMASLGMTLFQRDDPDGYSELGVDWMDTHSLLERLRFCQNLAINGESSGGRWSLERLMHDQDLTTAEEVLEYFNQLLFQGRLSEHRKRVILDFANTTNSGRPDPVSQLRGSRKMNRLRQMVGMVLSTQEFQTQ